MRSHIKLLYSPYHAAVKRSLRVFSTSPARNVLPESGLPLISVRINTTTGKLIPQLLLGPNNIISSDLDKHLKRKITPREESTISICATLIKNHKFDGKVRSSKPSNYSAWNLKYGKNKTLISTSTNNFFLRLKLNILNYLEILFIQMNSKRQILSPLLL